MLCSNKLASDELERGWEQRITQHCQAVWLHSFRHWKRKGDIDQMKISMKIRINGCKLKGKPKKTWIEALINVETSWKQDSRHFANRKMQGEQE
jgi:hypothetical protein